MFELKGTEELFLMTLKIDAKFGERLTCGFANFDQSTRTSHNWDFDGILLFKAENVKA